MNVGNDGRWHSPRPLPGDVESRLPLVTRFFVRLSGGDPSLLALVPQDRSRYVGLGATMLMTSLFAAVGMAVLVTQVSSLPAWFRLAMALGWGLFVLSIDYLVVTFVDPRTAWAAATRALDTPRKRAPFLAPAIRTIVRVVFAILVGVAVGESLVIGVFSPAAVAYLDSKAEASILADLCRVDIELSRYRPETQPAPDCPARLQGIGGANGATRTSTTSSTTIPVYLPNASLVADTARLAELDKQILFYNDRAQCELYPSSFSDGRRAEVGCSGIAGNGPASEAALVQVASLQDEKDAIHARLTSLALTSADIAAAEARAQADASRSQALIDIQKRDSQQALEALSSRGQLEEDLAKIRRGDAQDYGVSERFDATEQAVSPWIRWGLRLLFILADLAPVLMKTTMGPSTIDQWKAISSRRMMLREYAGYASDRRAMETGDPDFVHQPPYARLGVQRATPYPELSDRSRSVTFTPSNDSAGSDILRALGSRPDSNPSPMRSTVEARYATLAPVFEAIGWKTWSDIDIDPGSLVTIGELGSISVFDLTPDGKARTHADLYFATHKDFPELPLVVKCAKRGVIHKGRRPGYWHESVETPPDIPLRSKEALEFEGAAYHLANEIAFAEDARGLDHLVPPVESGHSGMINGRWHAYVVYPYFPNHDLEEFVRGRPLTGREFQTVGGSLITALASLWLTAQQRHRDLKLSNLLVDDGGEVWLTDFEVASLQGEMTTRGRKTAAFCAPEVLDPRTAPRSRFVRDMAADAYSVGAILYTLKTGTFPHWDEVPKHGADQRVEDWQLAMARTSGLPTKPIGMGPKAWAELSTLLESDPYCRVGLDGSGLRTLYEIAHMTDELNGLHSEEALRRLESEDPELLQRCVAENALGIVSRFMDTERIEAQSSWQQQQGSVP